MRTTIRRMTGVALLCLGGCTQVWAVPALQEVKVNPCWPINSCWNLGFSEPVSGFTDRLSYEPNQLLLHVPGAVGALTVNPLSIKQQGVNNPRSRAKGAGARHQDSPRSADPYQVHQQGNKLLVSLGKGRSASGLLAPCGGQPVGACQEPAGDAICLDRYPGCPEPVPVSGTTRRGLGPCRGADPAAASKSRAVRRADRSGRWLFQLGPGASIFAVARRGQRKVPRDPLDNSSAAVDVSKAEVRSHLPKFHGPDPG